MTLLDHAPTTAHTPATTTPDAPSGLPRTAREAVDPVEPLAARRTEICGELRHVRASAVARVVAILSTVVAAAWSLGVLLLWLTADALGATSHFEGLMRDLGFEGFRLASAPFFLGIALLGIVFVAACTVAALLATAAFNAVAHLTGGVPVTVVTDAAPGD